MSPDPAQHARQVRRFTEALEARDRDDLTAVLAPRVRYDVPQPERVRGREAYLRFSRDYPSDWHLSARRVVAGAEGGRVARLTVDGFWPEPYDPPAARKHLVRRC